MSSRVRRRTRRRSSSSRPASPPTSTTRGLHVDMGEMAVASPAPADHRAHRESAAAASAASDLEPPSVLCCMSVYVAAAGSVHLPHISACHASPVRRTPGRGLPSDRTKTVPRNRPQARLRRMVVLCAVCNTPCTYNSRSAGLFRAAACGGVKGACTDCERPARRRRRGAAMSRSEAADRCRGIADLHGVL